MKSNSSLTQDNKLTVVCRVEAGCLGPDGKDHVEGFCGFAQKEFEPIDADIIHWVIIPRDDISLPETQYQISNKKLSHDKATKYLGIFERNIDEFEENLHETLTQLIDRYLKG